MPKPDQRQCVNCYFQGQCRAVGRCDGYTPMLQELEELQLIKAVERSKDEYYDAWLDYISEF